MSKFVTALSLLVMTGLIIFSFSLRSRGDSQKKGDVHAAVFYGREHIAVRDAAYYFYKTLTFNKLPGYSTKKENIHIHGNDNILVNLHFPVITRKEFDGYLDEAFSGSDADDLLIFYYTGHCTPNEINDESWPGETATTSRGLFFGWELFDITKEDWKGKPEGFNYSFNDLLHKLSEYESDKVVIIIDACVAGWLIEDSLERFPDKEFKNKVSIITSTDRFNNEAFDLFTRRMVRTSGGYDLYQLGAYGDFYENGSTVGYIERPNTSEHPLIYMESDENKDGVVNLYEAFKAGKGKSRPSLHHSYSGSDATDDIPLFQFQYLEIDREKLAIYEGNEFSEQLSAVKHYSVEDKFKIRWTSEDKSVAVVDQDGKVTGVSPGSTTITAHLDTEEGVECFDAKVECKVTVKKVSTEILNDSMSVYLGKEAKIDYKIEGPTKKCTWTSSDTSVATVKNGKVEGIKPGQVTVTLKANGKSDSIQVTVQEPIIESDNLTIHKGESKQIPYRLYGPNGDIKFSSSDKSIVSVDKKGVATGHKVGTAQITLKAYKSKTIIEVRVVDSNDQDESTSAVQGVHDEFGGGETVDGEGEEDSSAGESNAENPPEQEQQQEDPPEQDLTMEGIGLAYGHYDGIKPQGDGAIPAEVDLYEDGTFRMHCLFDLFSMNSSDHTYTGTYTVDRINGDGHPVLVFSTDDREFEMIYNGSMLSHDNFFFFIE